MIEINSSRCGAGKTTGLIKKAKKLFASGNSVLIVQPGLHLINETHEKLKLSTPITSENHEKVISNIISASYKTTPQILIITTKAFLELDTLYLPNWHLIIDEEICPIEHHSFNLSPIDGIDLCFDKLFDFYSHNGYKQVKAKDEAEILDLLDKRHVFTEKTGFGLLLKHIISQYYDVYITLEMHDKFKNNNYGQFHGFSVIKEEKYTNFKSVSLYGANLEDSLMLKAIAGKTDLVHEFKPHEFNNCTIHMAYGELHPIRWSDNLRKKNPRIKQEFVQQVIKNIGNDEFIYADNNNEINPFSGMSNAIKIKHNAHGINDYKHINHVVLLSSLNLNPTYAKFVNDFFKLGDDPNVIKKYFTVPVFYQLMMRTSLRMIEYLGQSYQGREVHVYIIDGYVAEYLEKNYMSGVKVSPLFVGFKQEVKQDALSGADRRKVKRIKESFGPLASGLTAREITQAPIWATWHDIKGKNKRQKIEELMEDMDEGLKDLFKI